VPIKYPTGPVNHFPAPTAKLEDPYPRLRSIMAALTPVTLGKRSRECREAFVGLLDGIPTLSRSASRDDDSWRYDGDLGASGSSAVPKDLETIEFLQDQLVRFDIWSANIGALSSGRASLDYRLMYHETTRDMCMQLLDMLHRNLLSCKLL
jgi:hypothetical protein